MVDSKTGKGFNQSPVKVSYDLDTVSDTVVGMFLAPWVACRFGFGDKYLRFLFRHAHFMNLYTLLKNKNVSAELLHEVVVNENSNLSFMAYLALVNHRNCSDETVAYLLRDEGLRSLVSSQKKILRKGLHFLRDSGDVKDYNLYLEIVTDSLNYNFDNPEDILFIDPEDLGALFSDPNSGYAKAWSHHRIVETFANKETPKAYLQEFVAGAGLASKYREEFYDVLSSLDGFNIEGVPDSWMRKAYGLDSVTVKPHDFFASETNNFKVI